MRSETSGREALVALFDRDHESITHLLRSVATLCTQRSYLSAARVFAEFRRTQEHHFAEEERTLLELDQHHRWAGVFLKQMHDEHGRIRRSMEFVWNAICQNDEARFARAMPELVAEVDHHSRMEKNQLLHAVGTAELSAHELTEVLKRTHSA